MLKIYKNVGFHVFFYVGLQKLQRSVAVFSLFDCFVKTATARSSFGYRKK